MYSIWTPGPFHIESNLIPYGLRHIHYGFHGLVSHGLHGLTQNRREYLLIILVSKCRVIDKMMYFVQRTGSGHMTCSHVNQSLVMSINHISTTTPFSHPLTTHHLYDFYHKSRCKTTWPGQLQGATMTCDHTSDS